MSPQSALDLARSTIKAELGIEVDPQLLSNLHMCYYNAVLGKRLTPLEDWQLFLAHICWPEETEFPEYMFLIDKDQVPGYKRLMQRLEELYDE